MMQMIQTSLQSEVSLNGTCSLLYEGLSNNDGMLLLILHPAACAQDHGSQPNKPSPFERMAVLHHPNPPGVGQHRSPPLTKPNTASTLSSSYLLFLSLLSTWKPLPHPAEALAPAPPATDDPSFVRTVALWSKFAIPYGLRRLSKHPQRWESAVVSRWWEPRRALIRKKLPKCHVLLLLMVQRQNSWPSVCAFGR